VDAVYKSQRAVNVLRQADYPTVPWKNRGGLTREILKVPASSPEFDWRLSLATIATSGPFSSFEGYERTLVLVSGNGVELDFGPHGRAILRTPGQVATFDGAWPTSGALIEGPSTDLNLMVAKARARAQARVISLRTPEILLTAGWEETLICCIAGEASLESESASSALLSGGDVARCSPDDGVVRCGSHNSERALVFVAAVRHEASGQARR
jgi:uncharacterized protein